MSDSDDLCELRMLAMRLTQLHQADILVYSGAMTGLGDGNVSLERADRARRPTCLLALRTLGGSVDAAYRLARTLRRAYHCLIVYVDDFCKGAGLLPALAADELVISDFGELGPLQVAEMEGASAMAALYAQRLGAGHLKAGALDRLLTGYPSRDFVIDREEASDLLHTVRAPTPDESIFLTYLEPVITARRLQGRMLVLEDALALMGTEELAQASG
jgi:hypothetical protein